MAICAYDLALLDFCFYDRKVPSLRYEVGYVGTLLPSDVIELEHVPRMATMAVGADCLLAKCPGMAPPFPAVLGLVLCGAERVVAGVGTVVGLEPRSLAPLAVRSLGPLGLVLEVEIAERLRLAAPSALLLCH